MKTRFTSLVRALVPCVMMAWCGSASATAPVAPTLTSVSTTTSLSNGARGFLVQWTDNSSDEDFFVIYARIGTTGLFGRVTQTTVEVPYAGPPAATLLEAEPNVVFQKFYADSTKVFATGTVLQFVVAACKGKYQANRVSLNEAGGIAVAGDWLAISESSALSNVVSVSWPAAAATFDPPSALSVTSTDNGHIKVTFTDNSNQEDSYQIQIRKSSATAVDADFKSFKDFFGLSAVYDWPFQLSTRTITLQPPVYDSAGALHSISLTPGVSYDFRIQGVRVSNTPLATDWSNIANLVMPTLTAPANFQVESNRELTLSFSWDDNSANESYYLLQYRPIGGAFDPTGASATYYIGADSKTASITFPSPDTTYDWTVVPAFLLSVDASGNPTWQTPFTPGSVIQAKTTFNPPTDLTATVNSDDPTSANSIVTLTWTDHSAVETGFEVLYSNSNVTDQSAGFATSSAGVGGRKSVTLTSSLPAGESALRLKVRAYNTDSSTTANSAASNEVTVVTKNAITSNLHPAITVGTPFMDGTTAAPTTYAVTTSNDALISSSSVTGLPPGLTYHSATHVIDGTPTEGGLYLAQIAATFTDGKTSTSTLQLRVATPPAAPSKPVIITDRSIGVNNPMLIPLSDMFADPDSEKAVKLTLKQGSAGTSQDVVMILTPTLTPKTVNNFMNYVLAGDYNGTVFHRAATIDYADPADTTPSTLPHINYPFVVQGGGYKPAPESGNASIFAPVLERTSPQNEPGIANLRGTIAMAKLGTDPNSATHDFFFSLDDRNSTDPRGATLDAQNGGFTVFGRVAAGGMAVMDQIYALQKASYTLTLRDPRGGSTYAGGPFADWPVTGATAPTAVTPSAMVTIEKIVPIDDVLSYALTSSSANVTASIENKQLKLVGLATGTSLITVTATDLDGNSTPQSFTVTVDAGAQYPMITQHPVNVSVDRGGNATFTVVASAATSYQWQKDGVSLADGAVPGSATISGAATSSLTLTDVQIADAAAVYTVVVKNDVTSVTSNPATISFRTPVIVTQPAQPSGALAYGSSLTLSVGAIATPPITLQWKKNGAIIPLATGTSFTLTGVKGTDAGVYTVVVTGRGISTTSDPVTIAVDLTTDSDGDGLTNVEEAALKTNPLKTDTDGDGYSDALEHALGSNPLSAASTPASKYYVASHDGTATLSSLLMKQIPASTLQNSLNSGTLTAVSPYWLEATELTNKQYAAVLQRALSTMKNIDVISLGTAIRYPISTGNTICYLANYSGLDRTDILFDAATSTFYVPAAKANLPVRAVSWEGAFLAAVVLNDLQGYASKTASLWSFVTADDGYYIPTYLEWEAAARGEPFNNFPYPTGGTPTSALAWFNQSAVTATPRAVSSYRPNIFGVYDLAGNIAEWVQTTKLGGSDHYIRGGSYSDPVTALANDQSQSASQITIDRHVGVRLALKANSSPTISKNPSAQLVRTDQALVLESASSGAPPLVTQWLRNGVAVKGQTNQILSIPNPSLGYAGRYKARVTTNGVQPKETTEVPVSVVQVPTKLDYVVPSPTNLKLQVRAAAAKGHTLQYTWYANGTLLTSADSTSYFNGFTTNTLTLNNAQPSDTASYRCVISVAEDNAVSTSVTFTVRVQQPPQFTSPLNFPKSAVGQAFLYQPDYTFGATTLPLTFSATGLPAGLTMNRTTGQITGTPRAGGTFNITVTATNTEGSTATALTTLTVQKLEDSQPTAIGRFFGIISPSGGTPPDTGLNDGLGGLIDITATKAAAFTGRLVLGARTYPLIGGLNVTWKDPAIALPTAPTARVVLPRRGDTSLVMVFSLDTSASGGLTGQIGRFSADGQSVTAVANLIAARSAWNATSNPAVAYSGRHNVALDAPTDSIGDETVPQGSGYSRINVLTSGITSHVGKLPDATAFSFSGVLGQHGEHPIFVKLYAGKGSLLGEVDEAAEGNHYFTGVDHLSWVKKPQGTKNDRIYAAGIFTNLTPIGGRYDPSVSPSIVMGLATSLGAANARLMFSQGGLSSALTQDFIVNAPSSVVLVPTAAPVLTCAINNNTGIVTGKITLSDGRATTYEALVFPDPLHASQGLARGYFKLPGLPSATAPILSGRVDLGAKP